MPTGPTHDDHWKIETVLHYLEEQFPGKDVDHFPRGRLADLFRVLESGRVLHQLHVAKRFLERASDRQMLLDALAVAAASGRMRGAGSITVELH
jgi:hypothetical protein